MFLPNFDQACQIVAANPAFFREDTVLDGVVLVNFGYHLPGYQDFEAPIAGQAMSAHELRGLTFVLHPTGACERFLMLHKFHALNATKNHLMQDVAHKTVVHCSVKEDGSIVRFIRTPEGVRARTKSSFVGAHARLADQVRKALPELDAFVKATLDAGLAAIFELTTPDFPIVVPYQDTRLRLIQLRCETTGAYLDPDAHPLVRQFGIPTNTVAGVARIQDLVGRQATETAIEGWVVRFDDGQMIKVKTRWYDDFHDFFFEKNTSTKKMVAMVLNETMDDALAHMGPNHPMYAQATDMYARVGGYLNQTQARLLDLARGFDVTDPAARKRFATTTPDKDLVGLVMQLAKDPSVAKAKDLAKGLVDRACKREDLAVRFVATLA